jgi:hypothetical protein
MAPALQREGPVGKFPLELPQGIVTCAFETLANS